MTQEKGAVTEGKEKKNSDQKSSDNPDCQCKYALLANNTLFFPYRPEKMSVRHKPERTGRQDARRESARHPPPTDRSVSREIARTSGKGLLPSLVLPTIQPTSHLAAGSNTIHPLALAEHGHEIQGKETTSRFVNSPNCGEQEQD
jgi:hypothetical protein